MKRAEIEKVQAAKLAEAQAVGEKLAGKTVKISQKAGVDGRLFGSVTNFDIAEELAKMGFAVHKSQVRMPLGPIKVPTLYVWGDADDTVGRAAAAAPAGFADADFEPGRQSLDI